MVKAVAALASGDTVSPAPRWVLRTTLPLALVGLGIATYLTIEHFTGSRTFACQEGYFNCQLVTTSWESYFLGVPVAVLGLAQYVVMTAFCTPWAWRSEHRVVHLARLGLSVLGMVFVLWLLFAEVVKIHAFCEWCSGVHLVTFVLFVCMVRTIPTMVGWAER